MTTKPKPKPKQERTTTPQFDDVLKRMLSAPPKQHKPKKPSGPHPSK